MSARAWITASLFAFGACTPPLRSGPPAAARATAMPAPPPSSAAPAPPPADAATAPAPPTRADRVRESVLAGSSAFETVRSLTDEVGPRFAGSAGDRAAVAWAMRALAAAGLERVRSEPVTVPRWVRGEEQAALVAPSSQPLSLAALGGSVGTPAAGIEAEVIEVASLGALASLDRAKVAGKIVYVDVRTPRARDGSGYGSAVTVRWEGATVVAKLGGVALLIRSIGTGNARLPHTGMMEYGAGAPKIPAAALATPDADLIHRLVAAGKPVRVRMRLGARMLPNATSANVIGDVVGVGAPDEVVLLGAHLDSWDLGTGALDDGAGCAAIIEAARHIAKVSPRPRRTVRVVLFANEEFGLSGGTAYAKVHAAELARHVIALEADLGAGRVYGFRSLGSEAAKPAFDRMAGVLAPLGVSAERDAARGGADIGPLRAAGVPLVDLAQDASHYFDHHHSANDTLDKVDKGDLDQLAAAVAAVAMQAADSGDDYGRLSEAQRKAKH